MIRTAFEFGPARIELLSPAEQARALAMRFERRRDDFVRGRCAAKRLLGAACEVLALPGGRPQAFAGGKALPLFVSISHRDGLALAAVSELPVGADLELIEPRSAAFVRDFFTAREAALEPNLVWSAKESALKCLGVGLRADTRSVEIELLPPCKGPWQKLRVHGAIEARGFWRRGARHLATLVQGTMRETTGPLVPLPALT